MPIDLYPRLESLRPLLSSIPHLVHSNQTPLDEETRRIHEALDAVEEDEAALNERIHDLELTLGALYQKRQGFKTAAHELRAVISPVRRLPAEIISFILELAVHAAIPLRSRDVCEVKQGPWPLAQVSRFFRATVLANTGLWANIYIPDFSYQNRKPESFSTLLSTYLSRSSNRPLHVFMQITSESILPALEPILAQSHRWASATILTPPSRDIDNVSFFSRLRGKLPMLRQLEIEGPAGDSVLLDLKPFCIAPKLTKLRIRSIEPTPRSAQFPYHQIQEMGMEVSVYKRLRNSGGLEACSNLRTLEIVDGLHSYVTALPQTPSEPVVCLPKLQSLYLDKWSARLIADMQLPNLVEIRFRIETVREDNFAKVMRKRLGSVKVLRLRGALFRGSGIAEMIRAVPSVQVLDLADETSSTIVGASELVNSFLSQLTQPATSRMLVPNLKAFRLRTTLESDPQVFAALLEARKGRLRDVDMPIAEEKMTRDALRRIACLHQEGLVCRYRNSTGSWSWW